MFKFLLVPASSHPSDLPVFRVALSIARLFASHIRFLHVCADLDEVIISLARTANGPLMDSLDRYVGPGDRALAEAQEAFRAFCAEERLAGPDTAGEREASAELKIEAGIEPLRFAEYGRAADLLVVGRVREHESVAKAILDSAILETGRPVLLVPETTEGLALHTVAIAWNDSVQAARAVASALPLIEKAGRVLVLTVAHPEGSSERSAELLLDSLRRHNRTASFMRLTPDTRSTAEIILEAARAEQVDVLVMGAYGHAQLREMMLGSVTQHVLRTAGMPVLLAH